VGAKMVYPEVFSGCFFSATAFSHFSA